MKKEDSLFDRFALFLWRDRGGYDPISQEPTEDYNRSVKSKLSGGLYNLRLKLIKVIRWLGRQAVTVIVALGTVYFSHYLDSPRTNHQLNVNAGELVLHCTKEVDDVYRCRQVVGVDQEKIALSNRDGG
jgi:hypothetical protein